MGCKEYKKFIKNLKTILNGPPSTESMLMEAYEVAKQYGNADQMTDIAMQLYYIKEGKA